MRRTLVLAAALLACAAAPAQAVEGEWLAGDLHVHTTYSHDSYGGPSDDNTGPEELYTLGWSVEEQFTHASTRGLDFLAITDHDDIRSQPEPGLRGERRDPAARLRELARAATRRCSARRRLYDNGDESAAAVQAAADALRADGGVFQVNHPADGSTDFPHDADWSYLYDVAAGHGRGVEHLAPLPAAAPVGLVERRRRSATGRAGSTAARRSARPAAATTTGARPSRRRASASRRRGSSRASARRRACSRGSARDARSSRTSRRTWPGRGSSSRATGRWSATRSRPARRCACASRTAPGCSCGSSTTGGEPLGEPVLVSGPAFEHGFKAPAAPGWVRAELFVPDLAEERKALCDTPGHDLLPQHARRHRDDIGHVRARAGRKVKKRQAAMRALRWRARCCRSRRPRPPRRSSRRARRTPTSRRRSARRSSRTRRARGWPAARRRTSRCRSSPTPTAASTRRRSRPAAASTRACGRARSCSTRAPSARRSCRSTSAASRTRSSSACTS